MPQDKDVGLLGGASGADPQSLTPRRVQRSRAKGWRMPENTVYVGRPTKWGNPFAVVDVLHAYCGNQREAAEDCVRAYRRELLEGDRAYIALASGTDARRELRGKNLACWCPLDQPCHVDVLLEIANRHDEATGSANPLRPDNQGNEKEAKLTPPVRTGEAP